MIVIRSNLREAISIAIKDQESHEGNEFGLNSESCLLAGWKDLLKAIDSGEQISIIDK